MDQNLNYFQILVLKHTAVAVHASILTLMHKNTLHTCADNMSTESGCILSKWWYIHVCSAAFQ